MEKWWVFSVADPWDCATPGEVRLRLRKHVTPPGTPSAHFLSEKTRNISSPELINILLYYCTPRLKWLRQVHYYVVQPYSTAPFQAFVEWFSNQKTLFTSAFLHRESKDRTLSFSSLQPTPRSLGSRCCTVFLRPKGANSDPSYTLCAGPQISGVPRNGAIYIWNTLHIRSSHFTFSHWLSSIRFFFGEVFNTVCGKYFFRRLPLTADEPCHSWRLAPGIRVCLGNLTPSSQYQYFWFFSISVFDKVRCQESIPGVNHHTKSSILSILPWSSIGFQEWGNAKESEPWAHWPANKTTRITL